MHCYVQLPSQAFLYNSALVVSSSLWMGTIFGGGGKPTLLQEKNYLNEDFLHQSNSKF